ELAQEDYLLVAVLDVVEVPPAPEAAAELAFRGDNTAAEAQRAGQQVRVYGVRAGRDGILDGDEDAVVGNDDGQFHAYALSGGDAVDRLAGLAFNITGGVKV